MTAVSLPLRDLRTAGIGGCGNRLVAGGLLAGSEGLQRLLMPTLIVLPVAAFVGAWSGSAAFRAGTLSLDTGVLVMLHR